MKPDLFRIAAATVFLAGAVALGAQQYQINWSAISGGGGASSGGAYSVSGTSGQSDAGSMSGGNYSLQGGFWSVIATVATPGAPTLTITHAGNSVVISWPATPSGFTLQQNASVNNSGGWSNYMGTVNTNSTTDSVTIAPPTGTWFFRLKHQ